ncbi:RNA polymerase sigma-54 factor [Rhodoligotrophos appendicifer]|uniref:RNA polymerase factor sigma-54 n=1 Tax=Rhodoligotrophos appendicifer TaxID=987056 RepID=UPI0011811D05|nr:RNA polymerase factor sigma-54 [Rhodoligotrophos appendicifer]
MALRAKLELRQGQSLVMTPQLQQAIKLLQMSNLELAQYVETELERNPLLDGDVAADDDLTELPPSQDQSPVQERLEALDTDLDNVYSDEATADRLERDIGPSLSDSGWSTLSSGQGGHSDSLDGDIQATLSQEATLGEHLERQLGELISDPAERLIGLQIIGMLDEAGYLATDLSTIADTLGASLEAVEACLKKIHTFDPPGIAARNLKECLSIQLFERGLLTLEMEALMDNLPLLAARDFAKLRKICEVDGDELREMITEIRHLDPKPGAAFGSTIIQPVIPDVFVRLAPDGTWIIELNSETLPRVLVNNQYYSSIGRSGAREQDREYISECLASANWLVKSLEQRARTILKVSREIVRQQDAFFVHGVQFLRPLNLRMIADAIEMHESTVSRVTSNKYMATPRGTFELKYFFTTAIASAEGGESHSAEAVRHRMKELIESETAASVLSDDRIVELLRGSGIDIARRTVAKYREALGILSSVQRRREKQDFA